LRWRLNVCRVLQDLMSAGREFHVCGAATENARQASSVRTLGKFLNFFNVIFM